MTISPSDPRVIIAGIRQFGLAADGSDLRELEAALSRLSAAKLGGEAVRPPATTPCAPRAAAHDRSYLIKDVEND